MSYYLKIVYAVYMFKQVSLYVCTQCIHAYIKYVISFSFYYNLCSCKFQSV
jgi:hypothetical protein